MSEPATAAQPKPKLIYVADLTPDTGVVRDWFRLTSLEQRLTKNQHSSYLNLRFGDRTGEVEGRWWDADMDSTTAREGDIVRLEATTEDYKGKLQLNVSRLVKPLPNVPLPGPEHFFRASQFDPRSMITDIREVVERFQNENLKRLVLTVLEDPGLEPLLLRSPAALQYHHAWISGLLEHIRSLVYAAIALSAHYTFDTDMVVAACVLHDIGKLFELDTTNGTKYSRIGRLHGHIAIGFSLVASYCTSLEIDPATTEHVLHCIASHHGLKANGSPVEPQTREAFVFHTLDKLDATLAAVDEAERLPSDEDDDFTAWIPSLKTRFVKSAKSS